MKKLLSVLLVSTFSLYSIVAQTINGKIIDSNNQAVIGAYISVKNSDNHVHSNENGEFSIDRVKVGDTLITSHLSYISQQYILKNLDQQTVIVLEQKTINLGEVAVSPRLDAINLLAEIELKVNPVKSSQEVLRKIPGLFIGQHAGGGKAEQIFLRGFDIDHGTDVSIEVDGMPVNMVSHAHGQGYADLHFVIPETIEKINFSKGPYNADKGNFATAGYVGFQTKENLDESFIKAEFGQFNTQRYVGMFDVLEKDNQSMYVATEYIATDGPFKSSQNFSRVNLFTKYTNRLSSGDKFSVSASHFTSEWDASGQIPVRKVEDGTIGRFGAIDDTEGGQTSRTNLNFSYIKKIDEKSFLKSSAYFSDYEFELFSNFTFFLEDSINGDQIRQFENRRMYGLKSEYNRYFTQGNLDGLLQIGGGFRNDVVSDNQLTETKNRLTPLDTVQIGDVSERNSFIYANLDLTFGKLVINPGLRIDQLKFDYYDKKVTLYDTQSETEAIVSPKLNFLYNVSSDLQLYLKTGKGFHSNDTRVVVAQNGREILPAAYGADLGFIWKPVKSLLINTAAWYLFSEQEFVYVGDAGIVEPSGESERTGVDFSFRYQPLEWLFINGDANYTVARAIEEADGEDFIPLAPDFTAQGGIAVQSKTGFFGGLQIRHLDDRAANEDNSIVAEGYTVVDANAGYNWKQFTLNVIVENVLNTEWKETQFATESRLQNEAESVEEIHFTPGTPFYVRSSLSYKF